MEQTPNEATGSLNDEFARRIHDEAEFSDVPHDHATRFYDRIRKSIRSYVDRKGGAVEKTADYLLLVPDIFILLWRLANDPRVQGKEKVLLGSAIAYFIFPFDVVPEALIGPMGYLDDLVFAVYTLNKILSSASPEVVREHWSGSEDILAVIQRVLNTADSLIGSDVFGKVKKMARRD
jgi:uncharacterized membrane protein YkvA (DUF1232 family)